MFKIRDLFQQAKNSLGLSLITGEKGLSRHISKAEVHRPGLSLTGYLKGFVFSRLLVFGKSEMDFLRGLSSSLQKKRLQGILAASTPAVILASNARSSKELKEACTTFQVPLFQANKSATELISKLSYILMEAFCPKETFHGTLVEVFGVGILIQGESSVGKSEAALGLIERGHRLISDDVVRVKKKEDSHLMGSGPELTRHLMEIRGIGIINVAHLYGAVCVRSEKSLNLIVKLEVWDSAHFYDRVGLDEKFIDVLGVSIPYHVLPVKPGRDVVLLLETIALNYRLKHMGYHSAKEFNTKLLETIASKKKKREMI